MARRSRKRAGGAERRQEAAIKLVALGLAMALGPWFLGGSPLGKALANMVPLGVILLAAGAFLVWWGRRHPAAAVAAEIAKLRAATHRPGRRRAVVDGSARPVADAVANLEPPRPPRPEEWSRGVFDVIEWRRFEALVEALFRQSGMETRSQSHGADGGVDIWLYSRHQPGVPVSLVQCKHWTSRRVGVDKVRELRGVMASFKVPRGQFVTTATFTPDAIAFAQASQVNLLDRDGLLALIARRTETERAALLEVALEGDYWKPTCVNCGIKMVGRVSGTDGEGFWGCLHYPDCTNKMVMARRRPAR